MSHTIPSRADRRLAAFTLIELLVVISIISLLVAILLPTLGRVRDTARIIQCASNLRQFGMVTRVYSNDHDDWLLPVAHFGAATPTWQTQMGAQHWHGALIRSGHWTGRMAFDLDCPVIPAPSSDPDSIGYAFRPYAGPMAFEDLTDNNVTWLSIPRQGRNWRLQFSSSPSRYHRVSEITQSLSQVVEHADIEPGWGWGASVRMPYRLTAGGLAETTHDAAPNLGYLDGHVARIHRDEVPNNHLTFWD